MALPGFVQYGEGKKAIFRVTLGENELQKAMELLDQMKGWRRRTVYVNGEKVPWDTVFVFTWCFQRKQASFKPELYCFGYENEWDFNIWGCNQTRLPFTETGEWFCWGKWLNKNADWQFDKERIRHEVQKSLYAYRFCPAFQAERIEDVLAALPDSVNPTKDKNWKFVESYGDENAPGLKVKTERYGTTETVVMKGVCPNGLGSLEEMAKRAKFPIPGRP